ncbi:hypothetical protein BDV96DRAFT_294029 [Lophiotrema nucula]|uniref:Uncharacterized protein n=1 Tax=Lophiotrema nucula TaxID=690887 RepID=A0A6A5YKN0_9PLEO|nr:hypothetical protein BDV96DRAFT_294029 [Lophiotrema nucula]
MPTGNCADQTIKGGVNSVISRALGELSYANHPSLVQRRHHHCDDNDDWNNDCDDDHVHLSKGAKIAIGVVAGVVFIAAVIAVIVGVTCIMRNKRRKREREQEFEKHHMLSNNATGYGPTNSYAYHAGATELQPYGAQNGVVNVAGMESGGAQSGLIYGAGTQNATTGKDTGAGLPPYAGMSRP